ncbi:MAG TPA: hypothetical protein DCQ50_03200 [Chryseobacterium sp.]|nr:hypothetical protein [Chryseobacterium sp.]
MKFLIGKQLTIVILLITVSSILPVTTLPLKNTFFWWGVNAMSIFIILKALRLSKVFIGRQSNNLLFVQLLLVWYLTCIIRGCFIADNYWEWKNLIETSFSMTLPLVAYLAINPMFVLFITQKWLRFALPLYFLFFPFLFYDGSGRYLVPVSIFLLLFPLVTKKWKIILVGLSLFIFLGDPDARSNLIKFSVPLLMSLGIYVGIYKLKSATVALYYTMICLPIVLFGLGVSGIFNIFKMDDYIGYAQNATVIYKGQEIDMKADTRTFIYKEVIESSIKHNYYLWGRTPARGNDSDSFGWQNKELLGLQTKERFANEVSIANVFTWTGLIGVFLYFLAFAKASYLAVFKSKNQYARLLGLYIAFRWCYAWVEDFTNFDLSYLYLWVVIGLGYSVQFREMNDKQIQLWIKGIFDFKYGKNAIASTGSVVTKSVPDNQILAGNSAKFIREI